MSDFENIIILACSPKFNKYCVAGFNITTGKMVRLVTDKNGDALDANQLNASNKNSIISPLDYIEVPIIGTAPLKAQSENILIDLNSNMRWIMRLNLNMILQTCPLDNLKYSYIFGNNNHYLTRNQLTAIDHSLVMVEVNNLKIYNNSWNKTKANFTYNGILYQNMSVTDSIFDNPILHGNYGNAILVISMPVTYANDGNYYKLIAKIFPKDVSMFGGY